MSRKNRIPRTLSEKLRSLDDHTYLLRQTLHAMFEDSSHLKVLSAELRTLICYSSGTEGLLWRLVDELQVSDAIDLHLAGSVDPDHPLARGLKFAIVPIFRAGQGDPRLPPAQYSFRKVIQACEAVFISGKGLKHEYLIKAVSQQMGTAHEDDGLEPSLVDLGEIFINGVQPYVPVLRTDAELALQVCERVLDEAAVSHGYQRVERAELGSSTLILRLGLRETLAAEVDLLSVAFPSAEVEIRCVAGPLSLVFHATKRGESIGEFSVPYPDNWSVNEDAVFGFSYSSDYRLARGISSAPHSTENSPFDLGYVDARECTPPKVSSSHKDLVYLQFFNLYSRLLSPSDCAGLLELSADLSELFQSQDGTASADPFPA